MAINNPYKAYQNNSVNTVSPGELTLKLYEGCLKFIRLAKLAIENKEIEARNINLLRAQDIIQELMVTLNTDYEVAKNMLQMYDYMKNRLIEANIKNDVEILNEVEAYTQEFITTWKEVIRLTRQQQHGQGGKA